MVFYKDVFDEVRKINDEVELVAVSKTKPMSMILEAYDQGARIFGENRVQEIQEKFTGERPDGLKLYLIGHLQSNKTRKAVSLVDRIESIDSIKLLKQVEAECKKINKKIEILLEVNSSGEAQKSGFTSIDELYQAAEYAHGSENLDFKGLMPVGPLGFDSEKNRKAFNFAHDLFLKLKKKYGISVLSMGMSADWKDAIASGSTEVRIGSAIFGERK